MVKGLEAFERIVYPLEKRTHKEIEEDLHIIEKELKALKIIKDHWTYNEKGLVQIKPISMENAGLLKEVLL